MNIKSLVVTAVLATAILCSGGLVSAQTTDNSALIAQLQAQIATLMAQIKAIQAQQGTVQTWCHTFTANLGFVNSGTTDISALHTALQKEGFAYGVDSDTTYAEDTSAAVVQFQEKYGITQTGYVGTKTRAELNTLYGCGTVCTPNWTCSWGSCVNGSQLQGLIDSNNCGLPLTNATIGCPTISKVCSTQTTVTTTPAATPLKASCSTSPTSTTVNHQVSWLSNVSGGSGIYTYKWSGAILGTDPQESASFVIPGTMPATLTVRDSSGASATANCSVVVTPGTTGQTSTTQTGTTCTPSWSCTGFTNSTCINSQRTQVCVDTNHCGVTTGKPSLTQACTMPANPSITVTSPIGGTFGANQPIPITWTMNYDNSSASINIQVTTPVSNTMTNIYQSVFVKGVSGTNTFTIPAGQFTNKVTFGPVSLKVCVVDNPGYGGQDVTSCGSNYFTVTAPTTANLTASCSASTSSTTVNHQVNWLSNVSGGNGTYTYKWSGAVSGTDPQESATFVIPGTMPATLIVKDSLGASVTANCSVNINPGATGIVLKSPVGGEQYPLGQSITVIWDMDHDSVGNSITIQLISNGATIFQSDSRMGFSGINQFTIPASSAIVPGQYKACIVDNRGGGNNLSAVGCSNNFFTVIPAPATPLAVSCAPVSSTSVLGQRINWTSAVSGGSGGYTYSWSGSMFKAATLQTASPSSPGGTTQSLTVVDSAGNSATATCSVIVLSTTPAAGTGCNAQYQCVTGGTGAPCSINADCATATNGGPIVVHCSASPAVAVVGDPIVWSALAGGAKRGEFYNYLWQGDATGTGVTTGSFYGLPAMSYATVGTKTAFVTITVSGGTALATCSVIIVATSADIAKATPTPTVATPIDATQATMTIGTPTQATVASGQNVRLTLSSPNASHSSLYFACPAGVSMRTSPETCNTSINTSLMSDWSPEFFNLTSQDQNVVATYSVVTSSGTSTATTTITVHPEVAAMNIGQSSLASISDAIANIVAELKAMLNK